MDDPNVPSEVAARGGGAARDGGAVQATVAWRGAGQERRGVTAGRERRETHNGSSVGAGEGAFTV
jgi:hypothetical protein